MCAVRGAVRGGVLHVQSTIRGTNAYGNPVPVPSRVLHRVLEVLHRVLGVLHMGWGGAGGGNAYGNPVPVPSTKESVRKKIRKTQGPVEQNPSS